MRKFVLALVAVLLAGPAFAQSNTVNGVDRNSAAYRQAYLNTAKAGVCSVNLFQNKTASGNPTVSLWASNPVQAQACVDSGFGDNGGRRNAADGSVS